MRDVTACVEKIARACEQIGKEMTARGAETISDKAGHANFVTDMDVWVQARMMEALLEILPGAQVIAEEQETMQAAGKGYCFVLDPIDGTQNFLSGMRHSAISVGLLKDGAPVGGVVRDPFKDETFTAVVGKGAYLNGERIAVSARDNRHSVVLMGSSPYRADLCGRSFAIARAAMREFADIRRLGSAALDLCYVACGRCAAYFELILQPWDFAAGAVILREAGGRVEAIDGKTLSFDQPSGILAAAPQALEAIRRLIEEAR